jgi:hypothetical protein
MNWRTASRICGACLDFAETGEGTLQRRPGDDAIFRLRVPGAVALVRFDVATRTMYVGRVFAVR